MGFHHLSHSERALVFSEARRGSSQRVIAGLLGRSASTICRELRRGREARGDAGSYCPDRGFRAYERGRLRCRPRRKLVKGGGCGALSGASSSNSAGRQDSLHGQIAATLRAMLPDDPQARVSHETIYAMIYAQPRGGLKAAMVTALRQSGSGLYRNIEDRNSNTLGLNSDSIET